MCLLQSDKAAYHVMTCAVGYLILIFMLIMFLTYKSGISFGYLAVAVRQKDCETRTLLSNVEWIADSSERKG